MQSYYGKASTLSDILGREAARVVRGSILGLRKDPHMCARARALRARAAPRARSRAARTARRSPTRPSPLAPPPRFHQANLRVQGTGTAARSLMQRWLEAVLRDTFALVTWPVRSASLDQLCPM